MTGAWWIAAALVAALAWIAAFPHLAAQYGLAGDAANPIGIGLWVINCGAVWLALRLRARLRATGSGKTWARFDRPGTSLAFRMAAAIALALSICVVGLLIAWLRVLFA